MRRQRSPIPSLVKENKNSIIDQDLCCSNNNFASLEERRRRFLQRLQQQNTKSISQSSEISTKPVTRCRERTFINNTNDNVDGATSSSSSSSLSIISVPPTQHQQQQQRSILSNSPSPSNINHDRDNRQSLHPIPLLSEVFADSHFLAEGGYGRVVSAIDLRRNNEQQQQVAIKIMNFECSREDSRRLKNLSNFGDLARLLPGQDYIPAHIGAELRAHDALRDINGAMPLLRVEIWCDESSAAVKRHLVFDYEEEVLECFVMLVLPLLSPLSKKFFMSNNNNNNNSSTTSSIKSLARSLRDMHAQGWLHRDLSVTNIFASSPLSSSSSNQQQQQLVIGDFGLAVCTKAGRSSAANQLFAPSTNACTTIWYRSPEILLNAETPYTTSHDAWALGAVVSELLLGYPLFPGMTRDEQLEEMEFSLGSKGEKCAKFWADIFSSLNNIIITQQQQQQGEEKIKILKSVSIHLLNFDSGKRSVQKFIDSLE